MKSLLDMILLSLIEMGRRRDLTEGMEGMEDRNLVSGNGSQKHLRLTWVEGSLLFRQLSTLDLTWGWG